MRRMLFAALALAPVLLLAACGGEGQTAVQSAASAAAAAADAMGTRPPAEVAERTMLDEQGMLAAELAYKAARVAVETGVDAGLIKGATARRFAALDERAYDALGLVRSAYRAGNAQNYKSALTEAQAAISGLLALTGKGA